MEAHHKAIRSRDPVKWNQAYYHLKFNYLRNGINHTGGPDEIIALLDDTKPQPWRIPPPKNALPRTVGKTDPDEDKPGRDDGIVAYAAQGGRVALNEKKMGAAKDVTNQVARNLYDLGFRYGRTLGWGGNGIVALFDYRNKAGRPRKRVVKMQIGGGMERERAMTKKFRGQGHILQRQFAEDLDLEADLLDVELALEDERLMILEFGRYGTLSNLLHRFGKANSDRNAQQQPLPNRVLLEILHCLTMGCITMENPLAPDNGQTALPVVHFDLEPQNMLFYGCDQEEHPIMPQLKIADFGLAEEIPPDMHDDARTNLLWNLRWRAKNRWFLPEQFSQDWDFIDKNPLQDNIDTYGPVAGHFGPASNVYHVGIAMWSCITGLWPQLPRNPEQTPFDLPDGQPWWTYGWKQLDAYEGLVDRDIRVMVARCLVEEPARRVTSQELLTWCEQKIQVFLDADPEDAELSAWCHANFEEPPQITNRPSFNPNNSRNNQIDPLLWT